MDRQSKTRVSATLFKVELLILAALAIGYASGAMAETLVLSFPSADSKAFLWQRPADAQFVRILRAGVVSVVPVSDVKPTDRVASCVDDAAVLPGTNTKCSKLVPGRNDVWQLASLVFTPPEEPGIGSLAIIVTGATAEQADTYFRLYRVDVSPPRFLDAALVAPRVVFRRTGPVGQRECFGVTSWREQNGNGNVDASEESAMVDRDSAAIPVCIAYKAQVVIAPPAGPTSVSIVAPAPE